MADSVAAASKYTIRDCPCGYRAVLLTACGWHFVECLGPGNHHGKAMAHKYQAIGQWNSLASIKSAFPRATRDDGGSDAS